MERAVALLQKHFNLNNGDLKVGGVPIRRILEDYETPLFVYDREILNRKWELLRRALPQQFTIYYSVKANPNPTIVKHFLDKGCGVEVASGGEFYQVLQAGCHPLQVLYAGPGKTEAELELVLSKGIGEIHVESLLEAERIAVISRRLGVKARVAIRINPSGEAQGGAMRMGGQATPFGIDEEMLDVALNRLLSDAALEFCGIHLFMGTQILDHEILTSQYRQGLAIARRVAHRSQRPLHTVDFGGGLGIPYFAHEQELDIAAWQNALALLMTEIQDEPLLANTRFVVEPGRYLVGEAGIYVTRIIDIKVSRGKKFLILDGGMHHHLAASGNLGQVIKRNFPVLIVNKLLEGAHEKVDLVGPLCTPLDVLAKDVYLPRADVGDVLGVLQSGAYARTASPLHFLSHLTPAEVMAYNGAVELIRRRGAYNDFCHDLPS